MKLRNLINGIIIGSLMLLPGISGGTTAILLGIYDNLIKAVANIKSDFRRSFTFLFQIALGGTLGALIFARFLFSFIKNSEFLFMYLFMGIILGSVPSLIQKNGIKYLTLNDAVFIIIGFMSILSFSIIPIGIFSVDYTISLYEFVILLIFGFFLAVALILPGVSVSFVFLVFNSYERFLQALNDGELLFLFPLGFGLVSGVFLTSKTIGKLLNRQPTYLVISGFIIGSAAKIFPGFPSKNILPLCLSVFFIGFFTLFLIGKQEKNGG